MFRDSILGKRSTLPLGLYGITPEWNNTKKLVTAVKEAAKGGMHVLQFRQKNLNKSKLFQKAKELSSICHDFGIIFIINDNWQLAQEVRANGVHIGKMDSSIEQIRSHVDPDFLIGVSCYNDIGRLYSNISFGASYVSIGSIFPSRTKPKASQASLSFLQEACKQLKRCTPIVAIGGISVSNVELVLKSGIDRIAISDGLFNTSNIKETAEKYVMALEKYSNPT